MASAYNVWHPVKWKRLPYRIGAGGLNVMSLYQAEINRNPVLYTDVPTVISIIHNMAHNVDNVVDMKKTYPTYTLVVLPRCNTSTFPPFPY